MFDWMVNPYQQGALQDCKPRYSIGTMPFSHTGTYRTTFKLKACNVAKQCPHQSGGSRFTSPVSPPHLVRSPLLLGLHLGQEATAHHLQARVPPASLRAPPAVRGLPGLVDGVGRPQLLRAVGAAAVVDGLRAAGGVPAGATRKGESELCPTSPPTVTIMYSHYIVTAGGVGGQLS